MNHLFYKKILQLSMESQLISFTISNEYREEVCGWGNGYVAVPPSHPLHGADFNSWEGDTPHLNIAREITWCDSAGRLKEEPNTIPSDWWVIGFDTTYRKDTPENCSKEYVERLTEELRQQVMLYKK
jgi:hypothetical protein